jgi:hypothetical protein
MDAGSAMLTLVQIAAVVLVVLLVVMVARMTRTRADGSERREPVPASLSETSSGRPDLVAAGAAGFGPARVYDTPVRHPLPSHGVAGAAPLLPVDTPSVSVADRPALDLQPSPPLAAPPVPVTTRLALTPAPAAWTAAWDGVPGGPNRDDGLTAGLLPADAPAGRDIELENLAFHLRERATALQAERQAQQTEIEWLRTALADATREIEALRGVRVEVDAGPGPAAEPRLPNVNIYELRPARRR